MLAPKKRKFKKAFRGKISGLETKVIGLTSGKIGIKLLKSGRITVLQIESLRKTLLKKTKNKSKIWFSIYPNLPLTKKPVEVRMGKGKGPVNNWCFPIKAGRVLFELQYISLTLSKQVKKISRDKLSTPVRLINI